MVSVVHLLKGTYERKKFLDHKEVELITAFLLNQGSHEDPKRLAANTGLSFNGSYVLGRGFTFDDVPDADEVSQGSPMPLSTRKRLIENSPENEEVIFPYLGGKEVNTSPTQAHHRYVVDFRGMSEDDCRRRWPDLMSLMDLKVFPDRTRKKDNGDYVLRHPLPQKWWHHADKRPALYSIIPS